MSRAAVAALALALAACNAGPDYERPATAVDELASYVGAPDETEALVGAGGAADGVVDPADLDGWWRELGDPGMDALVLAALENNLDLRVAAATVLEADALLRRATGDRLPTLSAGFTAQRTFGPLLQFGGPPNRVYISVLEPAARLSWQADLFGKLRRAESAALADALATEADRVALLHTVVAQVVRTRVALATTTRRLELAQEIIASRRETLRIVERRFERGLPDTATVDVRLARENLAAAESDVPALERERALFENALAVLLGLRPGELPPVEVAFPTAPPARDFSVGVPVALLDNRPDLRAAEFRAVAASERIGVAAADLLPDLSITASGGWRASEWSDLFQPDALAGALAGDLVWRLFEGGRLRANVDAARARFEAAAGSYLAAVLNALREVEDALISERLLAERIRYLEQRVDEIRRAELLARDRYGRGIGPLLTVLDTERRRRVAEDLLILARDSLWNARVDLALSLGGAWVPSVETDDPPRS